MVDFDETLCDIVQNLNKRPKNYRLVKNLEILFQTWYDIVQDLNEHPEIL